MVAVGFVLQPDLGFLDACGDLLRHAVDYYEVTPETTWRTDGAGRLEENGFHRLFLALGEETGKPFVAHGVGLSLGGSGRGDGPRKRRWLRRIAADQRRFRYRWYTDHLGATVRDGENLALPLPLAMTAAEAARVRRRLAALARIVPRVGVENTAQYYLEGAPLDEPRFLNAIVRRPRTHLLLDLFNLHVMSVNMGFDAEAYLDRLDLGRVIEIHLAGGMESDPGWLPSGRTLLLDGHDAAVPEAVWRLYERVLPRCRALRGVTLERMEGTVGEADLPILREELARARRPRRALVSLPKPVARAPLGREDGIRMAELLCAKLRFERLLRGSARAARWFEEEPRDFSRAFRAYHRGVRATAFFPAAEARIFERWMGYHGRDRRCGPPAARSNASSSTSGRG